MQRNYMQGASLKTMNLSWYTNICPDDTVAVVNYLWTQASAGKTIFHDIYAEEEKLTDQTKR
ncbi:MAG: alpha/beta hydrolase, partial [Schwartzia sp.]|nr:alpha/beta hydrolase [Schwartzia sp. (in: firmicutes)]